MAHLWDEVMLGTFAEAAAPGETVLTATPGAVSPGAPELAGVESLSGKVFVDVSNPPDFSKGTPSTTRFPTPNRWESRSSQRPGRSRRSATGSSARTRNHSAA